MSDIHTKGWGYEVWIHNDEKYCGKLLVLFAGKKCSLHYHKLKHETFYVQSGRARLFLRHPDGREETLSIEKGGFKRFPSGRSIRYSPLNIQRFLSFQHSILIAIHIA